MMIGAQMPKSIILMKMQQIGCLILVINGSRDGRLLTLSLSNFIQSFHIYSVISSSSIAVIKLYNIQSVVFLLDKNGFKTVRIFSKHDYISLKYRKGKGVNKRSTYYSCLNSSHFMASIEQAFSHYITPSFKFPKNSSLFSKNCKMHNIF